MTGKWRRGKSSLLDLVSWYDCSLYKNCQYGKDRYSTVDCPPPPPNLRFRGRGFFRIIIDVPRNSLNSEKSPQKSSFSCKVYKYCHNFPVCKTASGPSPVQIRGSLINSISLPITTPWCSIIHCNLLVDH